VERSIWLKEIRRQSEERYDTLHAPTYDEYWGVTIYPTHERFFRRFLEMCPPEALILDAACGSGKYWPMILDSGRQVFGIDQSRAMLDIAHAKHPQAPIEKMGLQEMPYTEACDAACCMDAMEFVFPEDWPLVLDNLQRAIKPGGYLYFTVELADEQEVEKAFAAGQESGMPVVHDGGYHYYPKIEQVREWVQKSRFDLVDETAGDEYQHFLVRKRHPAAG
jgi:SAM-dependent methyltransferase